MRLHLNGGPLPQVNRVTDSVYGPHTKHLPKSMFHPMLKDYLFCFYDQSMIATNGSVVNEKAGVRICASRMGYSFSMRIPDYCPIYVTESLDILLALQKVRAGISNVVTVTDSLFVCASLGGGDSTIEYVQYWSGLVTSYIK